MSDTFPAVPADMLMDMVDGSLDYTGVYDGWWGFFYTHGRPTLTVSLARSDELSADAITAGVLAASMGADQGVWVLSTMSEDSPLGVPYLLMVYTDRQGTAYIRHRRVAIHDDGTVGPADVWVNVPTEDSGFVRSAVTAWMHDQGDPASIMLLLRSRGHYVAT